MVDWYNTDFPYRKLLNIKGYYVSGTGASRTLTDFPILWRKAPASKDSDLSTHARTDGKDIIFVISSTNLRTNHEIENYGRGSGNIWIKVPTLTHLTSSQIYMYYGDGTDHTYDTGYKPSGTWDINYIAVWHLNSPTDTQYSGSTTGNYKSDTISITSRRASNGVISWDSPNWGAANQYIRVPHNAALTFNASDMTIEAWINSNNWATEQAVILKNHGANTGWQHELYPANNHMIQAGEGAGGLTTTNSNPFPVNDTWYNEAVIWNTTTNLASFYCNGKIQTVGADNGMVDWPANTDNLFIGLLYDLANYDFNGEMDEIRLSNTVRTSAWLKTAYSSMSVPATFLLFGAEENAPAAGPTVAWSSFRTFVGTLTSWTRNSGQYTKTSGMEFYSSTPSTFRFTTLKNSSNVFYPYGTTASWRLLSGNSDFT